MSTTTTPKPAPPATPNIAIYTGGDPTDENISTLFNDIAAGTYTTVVLWAAHVDSFGNINMNDDPVAQNGKLVSSAQAWAKLVAGLKSAPKTTINRVELSIGGDSTSFANIASLVSQYGSGSSNPLYPNLQILQAALNLDAINYDDESEYDPKSSADLAAMSANLGMRVSICPFTNQQYWVNLVTAINKSNPGTADAVYLQCYDGGADNTYDLPSWNNSFQPTGLNIAPGMWATHEEGTPPVCTTSTSASQAETQMAKWAQQTSLAGGWMFCGTDMLNCPGGGTPADYSTAIASGLKQSSR